MIRRVIIWLLELEGRELAEKGTMTGLDAAEFRVEPRVLGGIRIT